MRALLILLVAIHKVIASCDLPQEIGSIPLPFRRVPFSIKMEEDRLLIDCAWIGAKYDLASSLFILEGPLSCDNLTVKWITDAAYETPQFMSCLTTDISFYAWPEYCHLFDVPENGSNNRLLVFQDSENYCPRDSELQLADGTQIMELRCMGKGANFRATFFNGTSADIYTPKTRCTKIN